MGNSVPDRQLDGMKTPEHKLTSSDNGLQLSDLVWSWVPKDVWSSVDKRTRKCLLAATITPNQSLDGRGGLGGAGPALD